MKKLLIILFVILFTSCTENEKARSYGGEATLLLPKGEKLIVVTWKESNLWYLTRPMNSTDSAETYNFKEESSYGVWEGRYIIKEEK